MSDPNTQTTTVEVLIPLVNRRLSTVSLQWVLGYATSAKSIISDGNNMECDSNGCKMIPSLQMHVNLSEQKNHVAIKTCSVGSR